MRSSPVSSPVYETALIGCPIDNKFSMSDGNTTAAIPALPSPDCSTSTFLISAIGTFIPLGLFKGL